MKIQRACNVEHSICRLKLVEEPQQSTRFQKLFVYIKAVWIKANFMWAEAGEIQRRVDEARAEHFAKYGHFRWRI